MSSRSIATGVLAATLAGLSAFLTFRGDDERGAAGAAPALTAAAAGAPVELGGTPVAVAADADAVWVVDSTRGTLSKLDPMTMRRIGRPTRVGGSPFAVAVGEGAVWVAAGDGSVRAFDPARPGTARSTTSVPGANGLAVGAGGVWVTSRRAGTLTRLDPATGAAGKPLRVGRGPADVAVGEGAVWVADADGGTVTPVDPRTGRAAAPIAVGAPSIRALAVGGGAVWVARARGRFLDRVEVVRVDPRRRRLAGKAVPVPAGVPLDLAVGGGSVWVNDVGVRGGPGPDRPGTVTRIDAARRRVVRAVPAGRHPAALATSGAGLFVVGTLDGTITPVTVEP